jgi:aminoglycoside phosphotransferase (APT) family kinase protein
LELFAVQFGVKHGRKITPSVIKAANVVIKCGKSITFSEAHALEFVAEKTSIPVPQVKGTYVSKGGVKYIVMEYIKGEPLSKIWHKLDSAKKSVLLLQLRAYMNELRSIIPPKPSVVAAIDYSPCIDDRVAPDPFGPFESHDTFHSFLRCGIENEGHLNPVMGEIIRAHRSKRYSTVFTHGDLAPRNILVRDGKIVGIIDWETAGWFPEYWEYARAWTSSWRFKEWKERLGEVLKVYEDELRIEGMRVAITE